tara:strand:+ start:67 stop:756 length:690 start_codon:yes stop_codon:yes gene_type:complete
MTKKEIYKLKYLSVLIILSFIIIYLAFYYQTNENNNLLNKQNKEYNHNNPAVENLEVAGKRINYREKIIEPYTAYNFNLIDGSGKSISLNDLHGKIRLVGFIYTSCPDICPLLTNQYYIIQQELDQFIGKEVELIFITTDPEIDTPDRIKHYTEAYKGRWFFLTSKNIQEIKIVWDKYDVFREKKQDENDIVVYHSYKTYLIDNNGQVKVMYVGLLDTEEVIRDIQNLL